MSFELKLDPEPISFGMLGLSETPAEAITDQLVSSMKTDLGYSVIADNFDPAMVPKLLINSIDAHKHTVVAQTVVAQTNVA